jgi:hypothetical protein
MIAQDTRVSSGVSRLKQLLREIFYPACTKYASFLFFPLTYDEPHSCTAFSCPLYEYVALIFAYCIVDRHVLSKTSSYIYVYVCIILNAC